MPWIILLVTLGIGALVWFKQKSKEEPEPEKPEVSPEPIRTIEPMRLGYQEIDKLYAEKHIKDRQVYLNFRRYFLGETGWTKQDALNAVEDAYQQRDWIGRQMWLDRTAYMKIRTMLTG